MCPQVISTMELVDLLIMLGKIIYAEAMKISLFSLKVESQPQ